MAPPAPPPARPAARPPAWPRALLCALVLALAPEPATCSNCSAGQYLRLGTACVQCPAGKYHDGSLIASGLKGLTTIAAGTLQQWTAKGVTQWKMGSIGQTCDEACGSFNMQCKDLRADSSGPFAWPFDDDDDLIPSVQRDTIALLQSIGKNFTEIGRNDYSYSPMCAGDTCYINEAQRLLCWASYAAGARLCPCGVWKDQYYGPQNLEPSQFTWGKFCPGEGHSTHLYTLTHTHTHTCSLTSAIIAEIAIHANTTPFISTQT